MAMEYWNPTLHAVMSAIGTRLEQGPARLEDLAIAIEGIDGLKYLDAVIYLRQIMEALLQGGKVSVDMEKGEYRIGK